MFLVLVRQKIFEDVTSFDNLHGQKHNFYCFLTLRVTNSQYAWNFHEKKHFNAQP